MIGPQQLPQVARVVRRLMGELGKATQDLRGGLLEATHEVQSSIEEVKEELFQEDPQGESSLSPSPSPASKES